MKKNYQAELEQKIAQLQQDATVPTLLLHGCCAPCSSYVLEYLSNYFKITVYFYNPNIGPEEEYQRRARELEALINKLVVKHPVRFLEGSYDGELFADSIKGLESAPEGGERCRVCFELRLREAAKKAVELGADYYTTTLSISPHKNAPLLNEIGEQMSEAYGVCHLPADFKKKNGYKRSVELSAEYGLYRQDYCGCVYSKRERQAEK